MSRRVKGSRTMRSSVSLSRPEPLERAVTSWTASFFALVKALQLPTSSLLIFPLVFLRSWASDSAPRSQLHRRSCYSSTFALGAYVDACPCTLWPIVFSTSSPFPTLSVACVVAELSKLLSFPKDLSPAERVICVAVPSLVEPAVHFCQPVTTAVCCPAMPPWHFCATALLVLPHCHHRNQVIFSGLEKSD